MGVATASAVSAGAIGAGAAAAVGAAGAAGAAAAASNGGSSPTPSSPSAPSTTVSAIHISADTGTSTTDFLTSQAAQTVTARLSAALAAGETLWASVDGGTTWTDVTAAVDGTSVSWAGATLLAGTNAIAFQVRNTAGAGTTASQDYTLDTQVSMPTLALSQDSGTDSSDAITSNGTLAITAEAGTTLAYSIDGGQTWSSSFTAVEGVNNVLVRATDAAGNQATSSPFSFTLDTQISAPTVALAQDSGASASDRLSNNGSLAVTAEAGTTLAYSIDGGQTWSSSFTAVEGVNNVLVRATDAAGNQATSSPFSFTLDTQVTAPTVALAQDSGASASDRLSNNGSLAVTAQPGTTLAYSIDGGQTWSSSFTAAEGVNTVLVRATDAAGNQATSSPFSFTLDTQISAPTVALAQDSGASASDRLSNNGSLAVTAQPGTTLAYSTDGGQTWSSSFTAVEGANTVLVRATDAAGNQATSSPFSFTLDTQISAPTVALAQDSGASTSDRLSNNGSLAVTAQPGTTLAYSIDGGQTWSSSFTAVEGANNVLVRATDAAGNQATSSPFSFTLDTQISAPTVALAHDSGASASDRISQNGTLTVTPPAEPGVTLSYSTDSGQTWSNSFTAVEGLNNVRVRATDVAGNTAHTGFSFTRDTTAPAAPSLSVPEHDTVNGVDADERASDGGVNVLVPLSGPDLAPGFVITLTVDDPGTGTPFTITRTVTQAEIDAGQAVIVIPGMQAALPGSYSVTATLTDLAGNTSGGGAAATFVSVPALVLGDAPCQIFGLQRRQYEATDASETNEDSNVFVLTQGLPTHSPTPAGIAVAQYALRTGETLTGTAQTQNVSAGGLDIQVTDPDAAMTVGARVGGVMPAETLWVDRLELGINSATSAEGNLLLVAHGQSNGNRAQLGVFDAGVHVQAAGSADAEGFVYAKAAGNNSQARVEACHIDVQAQGGTQASASLQGVAVAQGDFAIANDFMFTGIAAVANRAGSHASVTVHEDVTVAATATAGPASATLAGVHALAVQPGFAPSSARVDIGGDVQVTAQADTTAVAQFVALHATASRASATAGVHIGGDLSIEATGADASAVGQRAARVLADGGNSYASVTVDGDVRFSATATQGNAVASTSSVNEVVSNGESASIAALTVGGSLLAQASAADSDALATLAGLDVRANSVGGAASVQVGNRLEAEAHAFNHANASLGDIDVLGLASNAGASVGIGGEDGGFMGARAYATDAAGAGLANASVGNVTVAVVPHVVTVPATNSSPAYTYLGGVEGAGASLDLGGDFQAYAEGLYGATASFGNIRVAAGDVATGARLNVFDDINAVARADDGNAQASVGRVDVLAEGFGSYASIFTHNDISAEAEAGNNATALLGDLRIGALASQASARVHLNDDLGAYAEAVSGTAQAKVGNIAIETQGNQAYAQLDVDSDLVAEADSEEGNATATLGSISVAVSGGQNGTARLNVGSDLMADATAGGGNANATVGFIGVQAHANGSSALVGVDEELVATARALDQADAQLAGLHIAALGNNARAEVRIGGEDSGFLGARAYASDASGAALANANVGNVTLQAGAQGASAILDVGGTFEAYASGAHGASAAIGNISVGASVSGAVAQLTVARDVQAYATAPSGSAQAGIGDVNVQASSDGALAVLTVRGNFSASATAHDNATATLGNLRIAADGTNAVAEMNVGSDTGGEDDAAEYLGAYAYAASTASASVGDITVEANGTNAWARLNAQAAIEASANGAQGATAELGDITLAANGTASNARLEVSHGINTLAWAADSGNATAAMGSVDVAARAAGAQAVLRVEGDLGATAMAVGSSGNATASVSGLDIVASGANAVARVEVLGDAMGAYALADNGAASASFGSVSVTADASGAMASLIVAGNLEVKASGMDGASASMGSFGVAASGIGSVARVDIGGDLVVDARALGGNGQATASIGSMSVYARTDAVAELNVGGNVMIRAEGVGNAQASNGCSWEAEAAGDRAQAQISIGGSLVYEAISHAGYASADVSDLAATADGDNSRARVFIGQDLIVKAQGHTGASAGMSTISATAGGSNAMAEVYIGGNVQVEAVALAGAASASLSTLSVSSEFNAANGHAFIGIGGNVQVRAVGSNGARADFDGMDVEAHGVNSMAGLLVSPSSLGGGQVVVQAEGDAGTAQATMGNIEVAADAAGAQAWAGHYMAPFAVQVKASGAQGATAQMGNVKTQASSQGTAMAGLTTVSVQASSAQSARATLLSLQAQAQGGTGGGMASALLGAVALHAQGANATASLDEVLAVAGDAGSQAQVHVHSDLNIVAYGHNGNARASLDGLQVKAGGINANASVSVEDTLHLSAQSTGGGNADATLGAWALTASGVGSQALFGMEDIDIRASGQSAHAQQGNVSVVANGAGARASLTVDGDWHVQATTNASNGSARAQGGNVHVQASASGADASLLVAGAFKVSANANADGASALASAQTLAALASNGGSALISIGGNVDVVAQTNGEWAGTLAQAHAAGMHAGSYGAGNAALAVAGAVNVSANGFAKAEAWLEHLAAAATDGDSRADLTVGSVSVAAYGEEAHADFYEELFTDPLPLQTRAAEALLARAGEDCTAQVNVTGDVAVKAFGASLANAHLGGVRAQAEDADLDLTKATVSIGGDIQVSATAQGNAGHAVAQWGQSSSIEAVIRQSYTTTSNIPYYIDITKTVLRHGASLAATAGSGESYATTHVAGNIDISAESSDSAHSATAVLWDIEAQADNGGSANVSIDGNVTVSADNGQLATAALGRVRADTWYGDATVTIQGDIDVRATAAHGSARAFGGLHEAQGAEARLDYQDVTVFALGEDNVLAEAGFFADFGGDIEVGNVSISAVSTGGDFDADADLVFIAGAYEDDNDDHLPHDESNVSIGNLSVSLHGAGLQGQVFLGADSDDASLATGGNYHTALHGGPNYGTTAWGNIALAVEVGALDVHADAGSDMDVWLGNVRGTGVDSTATLSGAGTITLNVADSGSPFAYIDGVAHGGTLHYNQQMQDRDTAVSSLSDLAGNYTAILDFDVDADRLGFGNAAADVGTWTDIVVQPDGQWLETSGQNWNVTGNTDTTLSGEDFAAVASVSNEATLFSVLNAALDGDTKVAYAKYTGNLDLAGSIDIVANDASHDWYAVGYDGDGMGITSVVFVQVGQGATFDMDQITHQASQQGSII